MAFSIGIKGAKSEFLKFDQDVTEFVNTINRAEAFNTLNDLKAVTPVDTGRARNSWILTNNPTQFTNALIDNSALLPPPPKRSIEKLFITNGVNYIEDLNSGSSQQAGARFIEKTVLKRYNAEGVLFETL